MLVIFFWVLSVLEDLGVGDKSSGKLRRALCTPGNNWIQSETGDEDDLRKVQGVSKKR